MAKRLTEKQIEEIIQSFQKGKTVEFLAKKFNFSKLTIVRNLKKSIGVSKYEKFAKSHKSLNLSDSEKDINFKKELEVNVDNLNPQQEFFDTNSNNLKEAELGGQFAPDVSFIEIAPLECEIDNVTQKDFSSVPISP